jgi:hypothetical protein
MKVKKEYIVLAAVIVAVSVYLALHKRDLTHYELPAVAAMSKKEVTKLEVSKGKNEVTFIQKDNHWVIDPQGFLADPDKVSRMLDALQDLTLTALVSESQSYALYDLDKDNAIHVKAWIGERLVRDLEVGKAAPTYRHTFVKLADDKRVYHARDNFRDRFEFSVGDVRDKKVLAFQPADAQELQITRDNLTVAFKRSQPPAEKKGDEKAGQSQGSKAESAAKPVWLTTDGKQADQPKLDGLISTLSNLRCESYVEGRSKQDFTKPVYALQLKGNDEYSLSIFGKLKEEDKKYPAVSSANPDPFFLSESVAKRIMADPAELIEKPPAPAKAPETTTTQPAGQPAKPSPPAKE